MFTGWISLRVKDPKAIGVWYRKVTGLQVVGERADIGSVALGSKEHGYAIILLPGESIDHPDKLQMHFPVLMLMPSTIVSRRSAFNSTDRPKISRGVGVTPTRDPVGHTVELCTPLANAKFAS